MGKLNFKDRPDARILIRAANWVGDAIMTTPVIRAVRKNYPQARISVLAKPWVVPVYQHNPHVDRVLIYDNNRRHKRGFGTIRLAKDLRRYKFDMAILMQNAFEAALLTFFAGIPLRIGYNTDGRTFLLNPAVKMDKHLKKRHLIEYYNGILKGASLFNDGSHMELFICRDDRQYAKKILGSGGFDIKKPVIGINPGATGGTAKRWFPERYARLCEKLHKKYKVKVLIFGGPLDAELGDRILALSNGVCKNIAGKTTLGQAFALIEKCDLFVTNDSGLMHAAAALHVNQVAVIGSTDFIATAPADNNSIMVREKVLCAPCLKDECPIDHRCMDRISVDKVMNVCESILEKKQAFSIKLNKKDDQAVSKY
ncbi:MAG: lipopolysaccharide heptosyltransferase II [Desulfobacteraceae bacterium]|nr:lipopolysaccharide heptosyltransferase II [Desulfobacteraceae bacterium]